MTKNTPTYDVKFAAPPVIEINLNFCTRVSLSMLESIIAHLDIMSDQDSITNNCEHGSTFKERIQNAKWVSGDAIFRNGSLRLGQTIMEVQRERKEYARVKQEGMYKNKIQECRDKKHQINELLTLLASG